MALFGIGNIAKIAGLAIAGLVGYTLIKNAGSIGASAGSFFGGGIASLGSGISKGFTGAFESLDMFGGSPNSDTGGAISQDDPNVGIVTPNPNEEGFTPIASGFKSFVSAGTISRDFAEAYSFQPPARSGQLDVSKTYAYISSPTYRANQEANTLSGSNYGGYGSAQAQTDALASAIATSAEKYPEWFA